MILLTYSQYGLYAKPRSMIGYNLRQSTVDTNLKTKSANPLSCRFAFCWSFDDLCSNNSEQTNRWRFGRRGDDLSFTTDNSHLLFLLLYPYLAHSSGVINHTSHFWLLVTLACRTYRSCSHRTRIRSNWLRAGKRCLLIMRSENTYSAESSPARTTASATSVFCRDAKVLE